MPATITHPQIQVTACDPEGIFCCRCGSEIIDLQSDVVLIGKRAGVEVDCSPACANRQIVSERRSLDWRERDADEADPFE